MTFLRRFARLLRRRKARDGGTSPTSPFIDDPREMVGRYLSSALETPIVDVAAIHLEQAIHHSAIARDSGLLRDDKNKPKRR